MIIIVVVVFVIIIIIIIIISAIVVVYYSCYSFLNINFELYLLLSYLFFKVGSSLQNNQQCWNRTGNRGFTDYQP